MKNPKEFSMLKNFKSLLISFGLCLYTLLFVQQSILIEFRIQILLIKHDDARALLQQQQQHQQAYYQINSNLNLSIFSIWNQSNIIMCWHRTESFGKCQRERHTKIEVNTQVSTDAFPRSLSTSFNSVKTWCG